MIEATFSCTLAVILSYPIPSIFKIISLIWPYHSCFLKALMR